MIQISAFLASCLIIAWTIVMALNVLGNTKVAIYSLVFGTLGYPFVISVTVAVLKY